MGLEKMKLKSSNSDKCSQQSEYENTTNIKGLDLIEQSLSSSYLAAWFRCLKLSKQYTQNCRTGFFPTDGAYQTYHLFGSVEDCHINEWWEKRGRANFGCGITSLKIRLLVRHKCSPSFQISVDVFDDVDAVLAGEELSFLISQIRNLNLSSGLLSNAPFSWTVYKSKISCEYMHHLLDVFEAHEHQIRNLGKGNLWRIGEQLRLNPKAMTKVGDTHSERVDKHIVMGKRVSALVGKARGLIENACNGIYPKFTL